MQCIRPKLNLGDFSTYGWRTVPKADKRFNEDNCVTTPSCLAVFDGVGGASGPQIDVTAFVHALSDECNKLAMLGRIETPSEMLTRTWENTLLRKPPVYGASTATILMLDSSTNTLTGVQYGDSSYMVLRSDGDDGYTVVVDFADQDDTQSAWNRPHQLSAHSNEWYIEKMVKEKVDPTPERIEMFRRLMSEIDQDHVIRTTHQVHEGDIIILCSDGVCDNVYSLEIAELAEDVEPNAEEISKAIVNLTVNKIVLNDHSYLTPYEEGAEKKGVDVEGPKPDDVTVVVAIVGKIKN